MDIGLKITYSKTEKTQTILWFFNTAKTFLSVLQ